MEVTQPRQWNTKVIRLDRAGKHRGVSFKEYCASHQIKPDFNSPGDSRGNGIAERAIQAIEDAANTYRVQMDLPVAAWGELYNTACICTFYLPS